MGPLVLGCLLILCPPVVSLPFEPSRLLQACTLYARRIRTHTGTHTHRHTHTHSHERTRTRVRVFGMHTNMHMNARADACMQCSSACTVTWLPTFAWPDVYSWTRWWARTSSCRSGW